MDLLLQPPKCWNYRQTSLCLAIYTTLKCTFRAIICDINILFLRFIFILCVNVLPAYMYVFHMHAWCLWSLKETGPGVMVLSNHLSVGNQTRLHIFVRRQPPEPSLLEATPTFSFPILLARQTRFTFPNLHSHLLLSPWKHFPNSLLTGKTYKTCLTEVPKL